MQLRASWPLLTAAALSFFCARATAAQVPVRPTPEQAQELLRTRPDLLQQLQQRLRASGLTPDQIRARLRAEGYPETLLDAYLPGGRSGGTADTATTGTLLDAMRALGVTDSTDDVQIREALGLAADTVPADSDRVRSRRDLERLRLDEDTTRGGDSTFMLRDRRRDRADSIARAAKRDSGLVIFGLDLFAGRTSQFEANLAGPVDANYRLGPGDRLVLILTGDVEGAYTLDVTREGFVVVPRVGQLYVANLTLGQLDDLLLSRLRRAYSGIGRDASARTRFSVSVARLRTNQVSVVGDVVRPGSYRVSSAGTALSALYAAGGPTETGSLRRILIRRGARVVDTLDVYDYLLRGDASHDPRLETGDVIFVPPHGPQVRVVGEVLRPATYELKPGETLAQLVSAAGGLRPTAAQRSVQVERVLPPGERGEAGRDRVVITVPFGASGTLPAYAMQPGDVVRVSAIAKRVRNRVTVEGNVWSPGSQGFAPGARLSDAIRAAGGLKPDTYLGEVLIGRLRPDSTRVQLRATLRDTTGAVVNDVPLQEDDEIHVFSVTEFRPERYVAISGAVRNGGRFKYREGITARDLVLLAGGLEEGALLNEAEIARLPENRANGVTARTFRVPLDSSYLFERGANGRFVGPPGLPAPSGPTPEVVLQPYDNVLILRQPDFALQRNVFLGGEVRYPGRYALRTKSERLTDLIARAGGLTSESNPEGVEFYRTRSRTGRVGVDLPAALRDPRHRDNLLLVDGDSILIPPFNVIVTVTGAVNQPSALPYVRGQSIDYYIRAAGGGSRTADVSRAYVIQPSGKLEAVQRRRFFPDGLPSPRPGAHVVVPEKAPNDGQNIVQALTLFAQVGGTIAALVAAIVTLKR